MQRALTSAEQTAFRNRPQRAQWYAAVHKPASLYSVPISETPVQHPASRISVYSSSAVGDYALAKKDMTVWIGTLPGGSEEGKIRLRANATAGDFLDIAESGSGINRYYAAKWLTVIDEIQPTVKHPRYDTDASQWRMDYNETYGNNFEVGKYGPLIIMGSPDAGFLESGSITMKFHAGSTVFLDGTTVSTATWTFPDGQTRNGLATEGAPHEVTFTSASPRGAYVVLSVTDSAGKTEESRRLIWAFNDKTGVPKVEFGNVSGGVRDKGYRASFKVFNSANQDDFPEGAEVVIFESASYIGATGGDGISIGTNYPHREHIVFRGWIAGENNTVNPFNSFVQFNAETIDGILKRTSSYDIFHADSTPIVGASHWVEMEHMTVDRVAIDIIKRRSTISKIADFHVASGLLMTARINYQDLAKSSVWSQLELNYGERGTRGLVAADLHSAIYAQEDGQVSGGSLNVPVMMHIEKRDRRDSVLWESPNYDVNSETEMYGVMVIPGGSEWRGENTSIIPIGGESPGDVMGYHGTTTEHSRGLVADSQDRIITWSGNWRAQLNSKFRKVGVPMSGYLKIDPVPQARVTMSLSSVDNARGISWNNKQFFLTGLNLQYNGQAVLTDVAIEEVVDGKGGSAITFPRYDNIAPLPIPNPPPPKFLPPPGCIVSFNTLNGTRVYDAERKSWVARDTSLAAGNRLDLNGAVLQTQKYAVKTGLGYMRRSENMRIAQDPNQPLTDWSAVMTPGVALPGVAPVGNTNLVRYHQIIADRTNANKMVAIANQKDGGLWYSWIGYSQNMGDTWSWDSLAAEAAVGSQIDTWGPAYAVHTTSAMNMAAGINFNFSQGKGAARLTDTKAINLNVNYEQSRFSAHVADVSGTSINHGPEYIPSGCLENHNWHIQPISSSHFAALLFYRDADEAVRTPKLQVGLVSNGTSVGYPGNQERVVTNDHVTTSMGLTILPNGSQVVVARGDNDDNITYIRSWDKSNLTLTANTEYDIRNDDTYGLWLGAHDNSTIMAVGTINDANRYGEYFLLDITTGGSISVSATGTFQGAKQTAFNMVVPLSPQRGLISYWNDTDNQGEVVSYQISGASVDIGPIATSANWQVLTIEKMDASTVMAAWVGSGGGSSVRSMYTWILKINDDNTVDIGPENRSVSAQPNNDVHLAALTTTDVYATCEDWEDLVVPDAFDPGMAYIIQAEGGAGGEAKSLSGELSAGGGRAYVTYSDGTNIKLRSYTLPGLTQENEVTLSQGTIAEVDAKTWWVGVKTYNKHVNSVNNTAIWVYGRMDNLSTPVAHLAVSGDAGQTYGVIEAGLGTDNIAGLEVGSGRLHAFRNMSNGFVAYYIGWNAIIPISVAPLHIDYRGTALTSDGYILLGASTNSTVRVAYTKPVFAVWFDLTKDYPSTGAITGLGMI